MMPSKDRARRRIIERRSKAKRRKELGEKVWLEKLWIKMMWWRYRLSKHGFDLLVKKQKGRCVCGRSLFGKRRPHVDHDPSCCPENMKSCGKCIRGLLCFRCNIVLGLYKKDLKLLPDYLKRYIKK